MKEKEEVKSEEKLQQRRVRAGPVTETHDMAHILKIFQETIDVCLCVWNEFKYLSTSDCCVFYCTTYTITI